MTSFRPLAVAGICCVLLAVIAAIVSTPAARSQARVTVNVKGTVRHVVGDRDLPFTSDATVALRAMPIIGTASADDQAEVIATTSTDVSGEFEFFALALTPGTYELTATLEQTGEQRSMSFEVPAAGTTQTMTQDIDVTPAAVRGPPEKPTDQFVRVPIFFTTDRKPAPSDTVGADFLNDVSAPYRLSYGQATVTIPKSHVAGELEGDDSRSEFTLRADKTNHVIIESVKTVPSEGAFMHDLRAGLNESKAQNPQRRVIVFIHGYRTSFDHALRVAAQIKYDLKPVESTVVLYSWPSKNALLGYFDDQAASQNSAQALKSFLVALATQSGGAEVNVIAHSMGNIALTSALEAIAKDPSITKPVLHKVIMAAPDVPAAEIAQNSCTLAGLSTGMTLYASSHDQALLAATAIAQMQDITGFRHEDPVRAGLERPLLIALGLDTVDASSAITDFLGHGYFSHDVNILTDIEGVITDNPPPRAHLVPEAVSNKDYWMFLPQRPATPTVTRVDVNRCPSAHA